MLRGIGCDKSIWQSILVIYNWLLQLKVKTEGTKEKNLVEMPDKPGKQAEIRSEQYFEVNTSTLCRRTCKM